MNQEALFDDDDLYHDDDDLDEDDDVLDTGWSLEEVEEAIQNSAETGVLDLSFAQIEEIPDEVYSLEQLTILKLTSNRITSVSPRIGNLKNLRVLDLWSNDDLFIPPQVGELTGLQKFSAGSNCHLPPSIGHLKELRHLAIGDNHFGQIPNWLFDLEHLQTLQLWANNLHVLPDKWDRLPNLIQLNLARNNLTAIPPSFGALKRLRSLSLERNFLTDLPDTMAGLPLRHVRLGFNRFDQVPEVVTSWQRLKILDFFSQAGYGAYLIREDDSDDAPVEWEETPSRSVRAIRTPSEQDVRLESLASLPAALKNLPGLEVLLLHGHPLLQLPEEILGQFPEGGWDGSAKRILDYYFRTAESGKPLNEAKLILLGWGGVGKTSLVNRLVHNHFESGELRTEGIQVTTWDVTLPDQQKARLNVWDFGGQEIMHATHQFFLTSRSLYVLALSGRSGSADADAEYWLRLMESFAPGSPVIVAMNQISKDPFELDEVGLRQRFPAIRAFVRSDCAVGDEGLGIDRLRARIVQETSELPDLRVKFPTAWFEIKNQLSTMRENYLSFESFRQLCRKFGEVDQAEQEKLAEYLHLLGIALNYRDDPRLRDTHVLNPHWVTEGIYAILNSRLASEKRGEIEAADLTEILDPNQYPAERHAFLLELMRKFELCFPYHDHPDRFLVAELLPKQQPVDVERHVKEAGALHFQYRYPVLPEGLVPRFIVRSHVLSTDQPKWRSGCVLSWEGNKALIKAEPTDRVIHIAVDGPTAGRRRLLAVIRSDFEHIHRSFLFKVEAYVPVVIARRQLTVQYEKLVAAERNGMTMLQEYMDGEFFDINVAELLNGVDLRARKRESLRKGPVEATSRGARVFISYSHKDERHKDSLESHLKVLRRSGLIDVWSDRRIGAGDGWRDAIDSNLQEADLVILLISADFLASDYCSDREMREALRRRTAGECKVVPVIVRDCNWLHEPALKELQALPTDGKAVMNWENPDTAWRDVSEGIEAAVS
ncbi:TIR domain-containing protein [Micromonospora sp. R77]|uniref:COR domain-containing protein n=1 Tax=Micromonospora sp. R77 TaxID=2925836 RepID=UPI001F617B19|nr:COR domain-containing protein [Micromonospora sp. R77]MCI4065116.1 TIR domain-containing protein [Micromonospora sp. R77]